jgi:threonine/homoserine/homoserine lactone efflux protein
VDHAVGLGTLTAMETTSAFLTGIVAGLGVAVPPGAVAVLLLREALTRGRRAALAAGLGIASTDTGYALLAVLGGAAVAGPIAAHAGAVRVVAGAVLAGIAVLGLVRAWRGRSAGAASSAGAAAAPARTPARAWARFAAITLVNPTTALAFAVVVVALGGLWDGAAPRAVFVLGVALASAGWHVLLALAAARAGRLIGERGRARVGVVGHLLVLALAVWVTHG